MILKCISDFPFLPYYLNAINCDLYLIKNDKRKNYEFYFSIKWLPQNFFALINYTPGGRGGGGDNVDQCNSLRPLPLLLLRIRTAHHVSGRRFSGFLLFQRYFCAVFDYVGKADLSRGCWNATRKLGATSHFS